MLSLLSMTESKGKEESEEELFAFQKRKKEQKAREALEKEIQREEEKMKKREQKKLENEKKRAMVPQTQEEYLKEQSVIREVYDPLSGRTRLVKGSGEIIERIVTKDQQRQINKLATKTDGLIYSQSLLQ